jgi:hypothetical protein
MKKVLIKKDNVSVTLSPETMKQLREKTYNNSKLIERLLLNYFNSIGKDTKNIMI